MTTSARAGSAAKLLARQLQQQQQQQQQAATDGHDTHDSMVAIAAAPLSEEASGAVVLGP